jgi:hypothetical protein
VQLRDLSGAWCPGLPARVAVDWSNQITGVAIPAVQDALGADIACVYQVLGRQHLFCGQVCLNGLQRMLVVQSGRRRFDLGDEMWQGVIAAFAQMDLVPNPLEVALSAIAHFQVIGGTNPLPHGRHLFGGQAASMALFASVWLRPDLC